MFFNVKCDFRGRGYENVTSTHFEFHVMGDFQRRLLPLSTGIPFELLSSDGLQVYSVVTPELF